MDAVTLIWLITLLLALVLTAIVLPVIVRVVHALREIDRLARLALPSAVGIADNTATIAALDEVVAQAGRLLAGCQTIAGVGARLHQKVAAVGAAPKEPG